MIILNGINKRFYMIKTRFKFHTLYCYSSVAHSYLTLCSWAGARQDSLSVIMSQSLLKRISIESMMRSNHFIVCPPFSLAQHQSLFQWFCFSHQVAKVLDLQLQNQSFQWIGWLSLGLTGLISMQSEELSSPKPQFESINSFTLSPPYGPTLTSVQGCYRVRACSAHHTTGQWIWETRCWGKEETLSEESANREDGRLAPQNNHLMGVWMPNSFIDQRERSSEELRQKAE